MARESTQHSLDSVRPPRVHVTYDVEVGDAIETRDLPFIAGVLADLSAESLTVRIKSTSDDAEEGYKEIPVPKIQDRSFDEIDRDNLDDLMAKYHPRITLEVANKLTKPGGKVQVALQFNRLSDFHPEGVASNFEPLKQLLELRRMLSSLENGITDDNAPLLRDAIEQAEKNRIGRIEAAKPVEENSPR